MRRRSPSPARSSKEKKTGLRLFPWDGLTTLPRRLGALLVLVQERGDRRGWNLLGDLMSGTWHRTLKEAVSYGAFRTTGYLSETRIVNRQGQITHVVLIDTRNGSEHRLFSPGVGGGSQNT